MQRHILILITCLLAVVAPAQNKVPKSVPTIYVDAGGVMRWSDTKKEASFFGVNYLTLCTCLPGDGLSGSGS